MKLLFIFIMLMLAGIFSHAHASTPGDSKYWTPELMEWKIKEQMGKQREPEQVASIDGRELVIRVTTNTHDQYMDMPTSKKQMEHYAKGN